MGRPKIYTDEERKLRRKAYDAKRYQKNRDKILEQHAKWRAKKTEYYAKYRAEHNEEEAERIAKWRAAHKDELAEYNADYQTKYRKTPIGRASNLVSGYQKNDKKANRGKCTLTAQWIVDNIFPKPCHYCGAIGWDIIGCDRIDNSLPHTPDNVVPCCFECNCKRGSKSYEEFKKEMAG